MRARWTDFAIAAGWLLLDQATKIWATRATQDPISVIPGFLSLSLSYNRGALFGWLGSVADPWRPILLTGLPILAVGAIVYMLLKLEPRETYARFGLAIVLGGAVGNVLDRVVYGHVVDFLDVYIGWEPWAGRLYRWFGTNRWPTFNVADVGLSCGAALLLFEVFIGRKMKSVHETEEQPGASVSD